MTFFEFTVLAWAAALLEVLSILWHRAREQGRWARGALVAAAMEAVAIIPLWCAIETRSCAPLLAGIVGAALGTAIGVSHATPDR